MTHYVQPPGMWPKGEPGTRIENTRPVEYRLAKKEDGSVCLVGAFEWYGFDENGNACGGVDWRELPMMELPNAALRGDSGLIAGVPLESTVMQKEVEK